MLACIVCSKRLHAESPDDDDGGISTPRSPAACEASRNFSSQIRDMAFKFSSMHRHSRPCTPTQQLRGRMRKCLECEPGTPCMGSSSSTPASHASLQAVSARLQSVMLEEEEEGKEWTSQVEPGILITLVSLKGGGNDLKRIRFSRELFNKWQAQRWWSENYDKIMELYNIQPQPREESTPAISPCPSVDEQKSGKSQKFANDMRANQLIPSSSSLSRDMELSRNSSVQETDRSGELTSSKNSTEPAEEEEEAEWVEEDEPGVYITVYCSPTGHREIKRVRFSREKFSEAEARVWWEENRARIQEQYIFQYPD